MTESLREGEKIIIEKIEGSHSFQSFLLTQGITEGTILTINWSPAYANLINITVNNRIVCLRKPDFEHIKWSRI